MIDLKETYAPRPTLHSDSATSFDSAVLSQSQDHTDDATKHRVEDSTRRDGHREKDSLNEEDVMFGDGMSILLRLIS